MQWGVGFCLAQPCSDKQNSHHHLRATLPEWPLSDFELQHMTFQLVPYTDCGLSGLGGKCFFIWLLGGCLDLGLYRCELDHHFLPQNLRTHPTSTLTSGPGLVAEGQGGGPSADLHVRAEALSRRCLAITGRRELWSRGRRFSTPYLCIPKSSSGRVEGLFVQIGREMLALAPSPGQKCLFGFVTLSPSSPCPLDGTDRAE